MGFVKKREYKDLIEDERAKTGDSLDEIRERIKDPELAKSCTLHCFDDSDEDVYLRINRWRFDSMAEDLEGLTVGRDIVLAVGKKTNGFGTSIAVTNIYVIEGEEDV